MKTVNLVLSGGGARGYAHIGVIKVLKQKNYKIKYISGSSMGALIGGIAASGNLEKYEKWITKKSLIDIIKLLDIDIKNDTGFINLDYLFNQMKKEFGEILIENMPIKFTAVATNLTKQKEIWFSSGDFYEAIKASTAIPGYFQPLIKDEEIIVDGGVLNNMPIAPTLSSNADLTIAVDINANIENNFKIKYDNNFLEKMWRSFFKSKNDIKSLSIDLMMDYIYNFRLNEYKPDILIQIPKTIANTFDFHKHKEIIKIGEQIANKIL